MDIIIAVASIFFSGVVTLALPFLIMSVISGGYRHPGSGGGPDE